MARGINRVTLIGNLGADPEVRFTASGSPIANFRMATTDSWIDRATGQRQERTEWHSITAFNKLAEICQQLLQKGTQVYVEGRLQTRKWQGQDGIERYSTEVVIHEMQSLANGKRMSGDNQSANQQNPSGSYSQQGQGQGQGQSSAPSNYSEQTGQNHNNYGAPNPADYDPEEEEIPF